MRKLINEIANRYGEDLRLEIEDQSFMYQGTIDMKLVNSSGDICSDCSFHTYGIEEVNEINMKLVKIDSNQKKGGYGTIILENAIKELLLNFDNDIIIEGDIWIHSSSSSDKLNHFYSKFFTVKDTYFGFEFKKANRVKDIEKINNLIAEEKMENFDRDVIELNSNIRLLKNEIEALKNQSLLKFLIIRRKHKKLKKVKKSSSLRQLSKNDKR